MATVDLFTFLGPNSADYAEFMKQTSEKFLSGNNKINWKCINSVGCERMPEGYKVMAQAEDTGHVSMNHGVAINLARNYIESDYVIFVDADVCFLYNCWDEVIVNKLNKYNSFGGEFGNWLKKYRNFPSVYFFTFRSDVLKKVELDFRPKLSKSGKTLCKLKLNEDECSYFKMKNGSVIRCDTGWNIPFQFKENNLTFDFIESIPMQSKRRKLPFENIENKKICMIHPRHMSEWHYNKQLFVAHRHASYGFPLDSELGRAWKKRVELYIKNMEKQI